VARFLFNTVENNNDVENKILSLHLNVQNNIFIFSLVLDEYIE